MPQLRVSRRGSAAADNEQTRHNFLTDASCQQRLNVIWWRLLILMYAEWMTD